MARLLAWIERTAATLRLRLHYPAARYYRCQVCGGCTAMRLPERPAP